jgi:alpha-D-xyloside xylohydrolase
LTRGGGIGAQRNPYLWAGDQSRRFRNLKTQLAAVINSGISGVPFVTYDMGGYAYYGTSYHYYGGQLALIDEEDLGKFYLGDQKAAEEYESEIFVRALQFTAFGNMIQTHGDVRHLYHMTEEAQEIAALYSSLHEELADYLQQMSQIACDTGMPMIRHMILEYQNDANVADIDDQFMYGDALLLAPILTCQTSTDERGRTVLDYASTITREVYLPAGDWIDLNTGEEIHLTEGKTITVDANLAKIPAYLNTASEYAEELQEIFNGETWSAIKVLANAQ